MTEEAAKTNPLLVAALGYAARGIRVAPAHGIVGGVCTCGEAHDKLSDHGKHPRSARGSTDGTVDPGIIREWWRKWPDSNVMVCTGKMADGKYLAILDIDVKDDRDGHERLRELGQQLGARLPDSPMSLSGRSGGMHRWFVSDVPVRNGVGILSHSPGEPSGLDVRGEGGYVIAPPSRHYSGDSYAWDVGFDGPLPAWPTWLNGGTAREKKVESGPVADMFVTGGRDNALTSLAGVVRRKGMGQREIDALLQEVNRERCRPPLDPKDVSRIAWSVSKYPVSDPLTGAAPASIATVDVWSKSWKRLDADTYNVPPKRREYLLRDARTGKGAYVVGKVGMLLAEGGAGKTMALAQLALAVSTGTPWLGTFTVGTPGRVLLILGEEDHEEVQRRLYGARKELGCPIPEDGAIVSLPLAGQPSAMVVPDKTADWKDGPFLTWLLAFIRETGPYALVIVDPLSRFSGAEAEVDNSAATRFIQALESLVCTVICSHHTNKPQRGNGKEVDASGSRGSSGLTDGSRWVATLANDEVKHEDSEVQSRLGSLVRFSVPKSNYTRKPDFFMLRRGDRGTLLPVDDVDLDIVHSSRTTATMDRTTKRNSVIDERRAARKAEEEAGRQAKRAVREAVKARTAASVIEALEHTSVLSQSELYDAMRSREAEGRKETLKAAIDRHVLDGKVEFSGFAMGKSKAYTLSRK